MKTIVAASHLCGGGDKGRVERRNRGAHCISGCCCISITRAAAGVRATSALKMKKKKGKRKKKKMN